MATDNSLNVGDRVKRKNGAGAPGTVTDIRQETTATVREGRDLPLIVAVKWDNGTFSYFGPESLDVLHDKKSA
jgi:hypothetical protein